MTLFLADEGGRIVSRRIVDAQDERTMDRANAVEGFDFSEQSLGTNGLGTPIEARDVVFVRGAEHFNAALAELACAGAPVKHPITGRIVGSLAVTSHIDGASPLMVAMARHAAQEIAEALENMADSRDLELARTYRRFRASQRPVLVMNSGTVMTDLPALARVDAEFYAVLWERLRHHTWDESELRIEVPMLGTDVTVRRFGRAGQDAIFALEFLEPTVMSSDEATVARNPAGRGSRSARRVWTAQPPAAPGLPRTTMSNASSPLRPPSLGSFALSAAPGAASATRLRSGFGSARVRSPRSSLRATFRRMTASGAMEKPHCATDGGSSSSGERNSRASRENASTISRGFSVPTSPRVPGSSSPNAPRRAASSTGPTSDRFRYTCPPSQTCMASCSTSCARSTAELFPDAPAPRFSPAALQGLLAWPWSGNVAELTRVLAGLPEEARSGLIETKDLPVSMQEAPRYSLSRYEQGERGAIVSALREAGGNKARAADILGIGRTTLYRKMRTLKIDAAERMTAPGR